jgi:(p)ppGpp synthase/HD superfamily hydrolase
MIYTEMTKKAIRLMFDLHKEQTDKSGLPYVFHPWHVAESMDDEITATVALLHDAVEDTDLTLEGVREAGFPEEVVAALGCMTHDDSVDYMGYVRALAPNAVARKVKLADLKHNADITRLDAPTEKDLARREKYLKAIELLENY